MFDTENKENPIVKSILENLSSAMETLKNEIANIEEVYKKKLEEAKSHLEACLEETTKQYEYWSNLGEGNMPAAPKKRKYTRKTAVETILEKPVEENEDVVVDAEEATVPTDDLPFVEEEEKVVDTETVEEVTEQELDSAKEFEEQKSESGDADWGTATESEAQEEKEEDSDWGDFPADWK